MNYMASRYTEAIHEKVYRIYITDGVYAISRGGSLQKRYAELIDPQIEKEVDADQIALDVIEKAGLRVNGCI